MIQQFKPGDLTRWSFHFRLHHRLHPFLSLSLHFHFRPRPRPYLDNSFGLILKIYDPKEVYKQDEDFKYYEPEKDLPYLWFSLKEKQSFLVFQDELSLVEKG